MPTNQSKCHRLPARFSSIVRPEGLPKRRTVEEKAEERRTYDGGATEDANFYLSFGMPTDEITIFILLALPR